MAKKPRPAAQPNPAIRLSNLGPRLAQLFASAPDDPAALYAELDRFTGGLKPGSFLPIVVGAVFNVPEPQREQLEPLVGGWVRERELLGALGELGARQLARDPARGVARSWLEAGGVALADEVDADPAELFLAAFELGEPSQDAPTLFWYEDARRRRVCSASFLLDFQPPWEGAVKDLAYGTYRDFDRAQTTYFSLWKKRDLQPRRIDAATAAERVWQALRQNQAQGIRLPADFILALPQVLPFLLALPTPPDVEPLSLAEIETLATTGRTPESIRQEEKLLGYQTRMPDGSVLRIFRPPEDEEW